MSLSIATATSIADRRTAGNSATIPGGHPAISRRGHRPRSSGATAAARILIGSSRQGGMEPNGHRITASSPLNRASLSRGVGVEEDQEGDKGFPRTTVSRPSAQRMHRGVRGISFVLAGAFRTGKCGPEGG